MIRAAQSDLLQGAVTGGVTFAVIFAVLLVIGIVLLFRRRQGARPTSASGIMQLELQAGAALVRADESLASARDELGFAVAQFGEDRAAAFSTAVKEADTALTGAFRIKQQLDDEYPESDQKRRELTLQVIALAGSAQKKLDESQGEFAQLRSEEANAPASLASLRTRLSDATARVDPAAATLARITADFAPALTASLAAAPAAARENLAAASAAADAAEAAVSPSGVNSVASDLGTAEQKLRAAAVLLDQVERVARELEAASDALDALIVSTTADLTEARAQRENAPDDATRHAIITAIADVERMLGEAKARSPKNPTLGLDTIGSAVSNLDTALASARNQTERLAHATTALVGALASAKSQISVAQAAGGGGEARTRLAEAKRQLQLAENESDPVEALDAARRAMTLARDADALARYRA